MEGGGPPLGLTFDIEHIRYKKKFQLQRANILAKRNTHRNLFEILLNQPEIRLYLPFSSIDLEQQTVTSVCLLFQINPGAW